jgi:hypothetical protein
MFFVLAIRRLDRFLFCISFWRFCEQRRVKDEQIKRGKQRERERERERERDGLANGK